MNSSTEGAQLGTEGSKKSIDQRVEYIKAHWNNLPSETPLSVKPKKATPPITIAISRQRGALGSKVGAEIGKRLGWPVYDREILDMIAERAVLRTELLESIDEHDRPWLIETFTALSHPGEISSAGYLYHLKHVMAALASHGKCVIVGRGSAAFLPHEATLRVRIHAPLEVRVKRIAVEEGISLEEAKKLIEEIDKGRTCFVADHFSFDVLRPDLFDAVFDTERLSAEACAGTIAASAMSMERALAESYE